MKYYARILPDGLRVCDASIGKTVPLMVEHQIYGDSIGNVLILDDGHHAILTSQHIQVGDKLSSGSFVLFGEHDIREVSLVKHPKYNECEVLREYND